MHLVFESTLSCSLSIALAIRVRCLGVATEGCARPAAARATVASRTARA